MQNGTLMIVNMLPNGHIDLSNMQPLEQWQRGLSGYRDTRLIRTSYGKNLVDILTNDLGLVSLNDEGLLQSKIIIVNNEAEAFLKIMKLLGKIAESLIVRSCNSCIYANRSWGRVARRGQRVHSSLDEYVAVGTSLETTKNRYLHKYNPNDTQRDIIWIHNKKVKRELVMLENGRRADYSAGLQVKVSTNGFNYIYRKDISRAKYEVPLVYFDLCNDYYTLTNAIYKEEIDFTPGVDLVRGRDIDYSIHDALISYFFLIKDIVLGKLNINELMMCDKDTLNSVASEIIEQETDSKAIIITS